MTSWNRTLPLPRPSEDELEAARSAPASAPESAPQPSAVSVALSSGPPSSGEFDDSPFDTPSSWGGVPAQVMVQPSPAYPPLPRPFFPTQASLLAHLPEPVDGPPTEPPSSGPTLFQEFPAGLLPAPASAPDLPPVTRTPRRTVVLLGQTASVEAPEANHLDEIPSPRADQPASRPLPPDAPPWAVMARYLATYLESTIAQGDASPFLRVSVQRALAAFRLSGHPPAQIVRVYHLIERAHDALRSTPRGDLREVIHDCSLVIRRSLPADLRSRLAEADVVAAVEAMQQEPEPRLAKGRAVARLLGWPVLPEEWLLDAIDAAIASAP